MDDEGFSFLKPKGMFKYFYLNSSAHTRDQLLKFFFINIIMITIRKWGEILVLEMKNENEKYFHSMESI